MPVRLKWTVEIARVVYWPGLEVDLHLDQIEHPAQYPLVARAES